MGRGASASRVIVESCAISWKRVNSSAIAPSGLRLLALLFTSLLSTATLVASQDQGSKDYCYPSDYERQSGACDPSTHTRTVQYIKVRNCMDPFIVPPAHQEQCECSPEDYAVLYARGESGSCELFYVPRNISIPEPSVAPSCTGTIQRTGIQVDELYCALNTKSCTADDVRVTYSECYYNQEAGRTGLEEPAFEVIYYFSRDCNPAAKGSVKLPPNTFLPCTTKCGAGKVLHKDKCETCPAGSYSMGGALRFDTFYTLPAQYFQADCVYTNATGTFSCKTWHVDAGVLVVGPFDEPNQWYQDECASDPAYDCHNNLKASLKMTVKLVRNGYVKFKYTVSAEPKYDGLTFFIDVEEQPTLPLQSSQFGPAEVTFNLTEGYHTLTWIFSKDEKWTTGHDDASIRELEVDGVDFNDHSCLPCEPGYYSGEGATSCKPCDVNHFSGPQAVSCTTCPPGTYTLAYPRSRCLPAQPCKLAEDATFTYTPCDASTRTRQKAWRWVEPHICSGGEALPEVETEDCPPCPPGQYSVVSEPYRICNFCPPGTVRDGNLVPGTAAPEKEECTKCEEGSVAIKELNLQHLPLVPGEPLPDGFETGCSVGHCGPSGGWRMVNGALSSGANYGDSVAVWLKLNVTLETIGEVSFNFSVDIPQGDTTRGMYFYLDDAPTDELVDPGDGALPVSSEPLLSGPWQMEAGNHTLMWVWKKSNSTTPAKRDTALIYDIKIRGVKVGGATTCERVPDGAMLVAGGSTWRECPAGTFSTGGTSNCSQCAANTYNPYPFGGSWACLPCGEGTSSPPGSTYCSIGVASMATSFCTYMPPMTENTSHPVVYNLGPVSRLHPGRMFGPVRDNPQKPDGDSGPLYYVAVCDRDTTNSTCYDPAGKPLNTVACRVNAKGTNSRIRPAHSLGDRIAIVPLGPEPPLLRRGFVMQLTGERCFSNQMETSTNVTFICDPRAGYGAPAAWTEAGRAAAFNPELPFPRWADRSPSPVVPVGNEEQCSYQMVWYSAYACPMCGEDDYEAVQVAGCVDNKYMTYRYKQPQICQPNPEQPLPPDVLCKPCTADNYEKIEETCADGKGQHNVTYSWIHPKLCNDLLPHAVHLPENVAAGPCLKKVFLESSNLLKPSYLALLVVGAVAVVVLAIMSIVTWLRSRRIYAMYSKIVTNDEGGEFGDFGEHEEEMEEAEGQGETARLHRGNAQGGGVSADPTEYRDDEEPRSP